MNPLPPNLGEVLRRFRKILVPELNRGQLARVVRAEYLVDARSISKVQGLPFTARELEHAIDEELSS
jgi:2-oxoglutarate/2-oxoacid ferredoxin oxidoreductase subunit alpha